jgi:acylphosphatase
MKQELEIKVTGRVQMVMFRDFAQRKARSLDIVGTVQNRKDGSVYIVAQGEEGNLRGYVELLKKGPILSKVENVKISDRESLGKFAIFNIIF